MPRDTAELQRLSVDLASILSKYKPMQCFCMTLPQYYYPLESHAAGFLKRYNVSVAITGVICSCTVPSVQAPGPEGALLERLVGLWKVVRSMSVAVGYQCKD